MSAIYLLGLLVLVSFAALTAIAWLLRWDTDEPLVCACDRPALDRIGQCAHCHRPHPSRLHHPSTRNQV